MEMSIEGLESLMAKLRRLGGSVDAAIDKGIGMQAGSGDREDYIVIGQGGQVTAAVKAKDLKKV